MYKSDTLKAGLFYVFRWHNLTECFRYPKVLSINLKRLVYKKNNLFHNVVVMNSINTVTKLIPLLLCAINYVYFTRSKWLATSRTLVQYSSTVQLSPLVGNGAPGRGSVRGRGKGVNPVQ